MLDKLERAEESYVKIEDSLSDPVIISDNEKYASLMKEYKNLTPIIEAFRRYKTTVKEMNEAEELMKLEIEIPPFRILPVPLYFRVSFLLFRSLFSAKSGFCFFIPNTINQFPRPTFI